MSLSSLHDANVPLSHGPIVAGAILYTVAFAYAIFYNYNIAKSATLAISTSMLQQLAVLGVVFLFLRWRGNEVNRRSIKDSAASLANRRIRHCDQSILRDYPAFRRPVERWGFAGLFPHAGLYDLPN
jgi:hypothetical protein